MGINWCQKELFLSAEIYMFCCEGSTCRHDKKEVDKIPSTQDISFTMPYEAAWLRPMIPFNFEVPLNDIDNNFENFTRTKNLPFLSFPSSRFSPVIYWYLPIFLLLKFNFPNFLLSLLYALTFQCVLFGEKCLTISLREQIIQYIYAYHRKSNCIFVSLYI